LIAGGRLRGTMYGVYTFLESLGCRWYTFDRALFLKRKPSLLTDLDIRQTPNFEYRDVLYYDAFDADWAARNKQTPCYKAR